MWEPQAPTRPITPREREIILALLGGCETPKEVGQQLHISDKTVKNHLHSLYAKLGVTRLSGAIMSCVAQGIVETPQNDEANKHIPIDVGHPPPIITQSPPPPPEPEVTGHWWLHSAERQALIENESIDDQWGRVL